MTLNQFVSHQEQMGALRRDFDIEWKTIYIPALIDSGIDPNAKTIIKSKIGAWQQFVIRHSSR